MGIFVNLPSGKTIEVDTIKYLTMSDAQFQNLIADDIGAYVDNPFTKDRLISPEDDLLEDLDIPDITLED